MLTFTRFDSIPRTCFAIAGIDCYSFVIPSVRTATMPRFGWIGLILCLNPLVFLLLWFRRPTQNALIVSALMTFSIGAINAVQLIYTGAVSIVVNEFSDRLHSSWLWSVLSFFAVGLYLCGISLRPSRLVVVFGLFATCFEVGCNSSCTLKDAAPIPLFQQVPRGRILSFI